MTKLHSENDQLQFINSTNIGCKKKIVEKLDLKSR